MKAEDKGDLARERRFAIDTEPKANYPEGELVGPVAPLFHQNRTGRKDSISLS
jgi:hypothetical protein